MSSDGQDVPLVSVVMPTFNRTACLREAVTSILEQTLPDWELIIADDGSGDDTRAYLLSIDDPRVRILWLAHSGNPGRARNVALESARGRYVAFMDSDDYWEPAKLGAQVALLRANPTRRWCYTAVSHVDGAGHRLADTNFAPWVAHEGDILERLLVLEARVATPSVVAERALIGEAGGFDERQRFCEDYDLWLRLAMRSPVSVTDERLVRIRRHADRYSADRVGDYEGQIRLYGKMARTLREPRLRELARRRLWESAIVLAGLHVDAGRRGRVLRALLDAAPHGWRQSDWWWGALKTVVRASLPRPVLGAYQDWKRGA